ncbi:THAP domain-containing protein 9 [Trachymyrmex zeteki]|uniref:THAP domain-containing protein 9 n=1 Tax=Mycetomoellerius zeteki TaxID=64791 RepID=A0A151XKQ1_9HYME|nr:THAP domain-containing protein 9 [Trachymyrmex zeteki]
MTINFYSPKAYKYIRSTFKNRLPVPSTIRSWYSTTSRSPGCTQKAVEALRRKVEAAGDKVLYGCLISDEMAIHQEVCFNHSEKRMFVRNTMAKHILYDSDGQPIMFQYVQKLVKLQEEGYFYLANKLNRKHIEWWKHKMSVKIAAQTFSNSSAIALEQLLADGHPDFTGCATTVKFCRMVNDIFDVLNSRSLCSNGFKKRLMPETAEVIFALFAEATQYFSTLKVDVCSPNTGIIIRKLVIESQFKVGFCGFILDMSNLKNMYEILSYKISQNHLEILFLCFRTMGGYNNNPNAIQFAASYKKLLHNNEVKSSAAANCISLDNTSILTVASGKKIKDFITEYNEEDEETDDHQINVDDIPLKCINNTLNHAVLYVSGFVEIRVLNKIKCSECVKLLDECPEAESDFITRKSFGFLRFPRIDTCKVTWIVEKLVNIHLNNDEIKLKKAYRKIICDTMRNLDMTALFKNFDNHVKDVDIIENHKYELIKLIIDYYTCEQKYLTLENVLLFDTKDCQSGIH